MGTLKNNSFPKSEWAARLLLMTLGIFLPLMAVELFVYFVLDIRGPHHPPGFYKDDPITGWVKVPGSEGYVYLYQDGTKQYVRNNSHGFTDREREFIKKKPRIALVGDSTTEFWEAEEEQRAQVLMEAALADRWEVLNLGTRGFSTDQVFLFLKHKAIKYSPDIVIYTFCINDIYDNVHMNKPYFQLDTQNPDSLILKGFPYPYTNEILKSENRYSSQWDKIHDGLSRISFFYRKATLLLRSHPMGKFYDSMPLEAQIELTPYKKIYSSDDEYRIKLLFAIIKEMKQFLVGQGIRFLLVEGVYGNVLAPARKAWSTQEYGDVFDFEKVTRLLKEFSDTNGIEFLSLQEKVKSNNLRITDIMHPEDYVHLNAEGSRLYSDWVLEKLRSLGWI